MPSFTDIVFNFMSGESFDDSVVYQWYAAEKSIVFYGDDTWLNMYGDMFYRSEGVTSFYVFVWFGYGGNV